MTKFTSTAFSAIALVCVAAAVPAYAQASYSFDLPAQPLAEALKAVGSQTHTNIVFKPAVTRGKMAPALRGSYSVQGALEALVAGHGMRVTTTNGGTFLIQQGVVPAAPAPQSGREQVGNGSVAETEEIVVTAQKRETRLQDTQMSLSAIPSGEIARRSLSGMDDYLRSVPGASLLSQGPGFNSVILRGVALNAEADGEFSGPITGVYFGETPISGLGASGSSADIKLVDMQRIEILKGPQGTLYGAGAMGGVVRNIPNAPLLDTVEGRLALDYSRTARLGGDNIKLEGMANVPIVIDKAALRVVGYHLSDSGYYRNISAIDPAAAAYVAQFGGVATVKDDVGAIDTTGGRVALLVEPTDALTIEASFLYQESEQKGWGQTDFRFGPDYEQSRLLVRRGSRLADAGAPDSNDGLDDVVKIGNLKLSYDLGWGSLVSSTSLVDEKTLLLRYVDLGYPWSQNINYAGKGTIEEARFVSKLPGMFNFVLGYYFEDRDSSSRFNSFWGGDDALLTPAVSLREAILDRRRSLTHHALFGEATLEPAEGLTLTGGARAFTQKRRVYQSVSVNGAAATPAIYDARTSDVLFKAGIGYKPSRDVLLYANWSQGFRLGDVQPPNQVAACDVDNDGFFDQYPSVPTGSHPIDSDRLDQYEAGAKLTGAGGRLRASAAAYQINWSNIPFSVVPLCGASTVLSAGKARIRGIEGELSYEMVPGLTVTLAGSYSHGEIRESGADLGAVALGKVGDRLPGSPEYKVSGGLEYRREIDGHEAYLRTDIAYTGSYYATLAQSFAKAGGFTNVNADAGIALGNFDLGLFAKNITNNDDITTVYLGLSGGRSGTRLRPRTVGVKLGYRF